MQKREYNRIHMNPPGGVNVGLSKQVKSGCIKNHNCSQFHISQHSKLGASVQPRHTVYASKIWILRAGALLLVDVMFMFAFSYSSSQPPSPGATLFLPLVLDLPDLLSSSSTVII